MCALRLGDGTTLLDYWIESWDNLGDTAIVWVKVPSVPALGTATLYMYYGNPSANDAADGSATFAFYDDFNTPIVTGTGGNANWTRVVIDNTLDGSHNIMVEDVDGDNLPDLLADGYRAQKVVWYQQPADPIHDTWTRFTIDPLLENAHDIQIGDIDGDGRRDVVGLSLSANWGDYGQSPGYVCWYKKPLDPTETGTTSTGWTVKAPVPTAVGDGTAVVYHDSLWIFGGHGLGTPDPRSESYVYDPLTNNWSRLADMPTKRWGPLAVEFDGKVHVFAGSEGDVHEIYDPATNTWQSNGLGNPLDLPQYQASGVTHPDVVYFPGGKDTFKYWMVYTPYPPATEENPSILRSHDGIHWTDSGMTNPVIPQGGSGEWNVGENADPDFVYVPDYGKWFMVWAGQDAGGSEAIGLAYSSDGKSWTQYDGVPVNGNAYPAIVSGEDAAGQPWEVSGGVSKLQCPTLYYESGTFYLYYVEEIPGNNRGTAGFASFSWNNTTDDVVSLTRHSGNPTINLPTDAEFQSGCGHIDLSYNPDDGLYYMYVLRADISSGAWELGLLTSTNLTSWTNAGKVLPRGGGGDWDGSYIYRSCPVVDSTGSVVLFDGDIRMYYGAAGSAGMQIGMVDFPPSGPPVRFAGNGPAPMPAGLANQGLMGIRYGNRIHLFYQSFHYAYDPVTDTYEQKANVPTPRTWSTCALVNDSIYIIGGYSYGNPSGATNVNEVYDPATDTWTTKAPMPVSKYGVTRENPVIQGKIYVTHGLNGGFHVDNWAYDPATDTWEQKSAGMHPRDGVECGVINDKLYVVRGRDDYVQGGTGTPYVEEYDPAADLGTTGGWTKTVIKSSGSGGLLGARSCGLGDIDSDGDLDIAVAIDAGPGRLFWYQNPGGVLASDATEWNEYEIDATISRGADAQVGDLDLDGNPDIVYADVPGGIHCYFAPPDPSNVPGWVRATIAGDTYHVSLVDFDGDGDLDVLRAAAYSAAVSWLENPYPTNPRVPTNWHEYVIESDASISIANRVSAADLDGDGDLDIGMDADPSGSTGTFKWYRRPSDPKNIGAWEIYVVDDDPTYTAYAHDSYLSDVDLDGDVDMVGVGPNAQGGTVMWWVNDTTSTPVSGDTSYIDPNKWVNSAAR